MATALSEQVVTVALIGNPNTGKSTLFNALAGVNQRVGNYPGVTVEKKIGRAAFAGQRFQIVDLPGTYSLAPHSPDEMVAVDVLLGRRSDMQRPDIVVCVVDASNLERNLFLVSQVLELDRPVVVALNMVDVARKEGLQIDADEISRRLDVPFVSIQANRKIGLDTLKETICLQVGAKTKDRESPFPDHFQSEVTRLQSVLKSSGQVVPKYLVERLLLDHGGFLDSLLDGDGDRQSIQSARDNLRKDDIALGSLEAVTRYGWIGRMLEGAVQRPKVKPKAFSDRLDKVLTHRFWGTFAFVLLMVLVFQSIFSWAAPAMELVEGSVGIVAEWFASWMPEGALQSLLVDGVIAGVGGVLVFLPQIFILFFFIAILEDCGYMARAAYLMDRLMSRIGLSGKSFIPLLSSFACAIPGVMATRVIENRRDRLVTILVAPLMSCSARLPVYTLLIAAFIPSATYLGGWLSLQGITMFAMYLVGIVAAVVVAVALKYTILQGDTPPFVMELPNYKVPSARNVLFRVLDRGWAFIRRAGTLILAVSIVVWAATYFPRPSQIEEDIRVRHASQIEQLRSQIDQLEMSEGVAQPAELKQLREQLESVEAQVSDEITSTYMNQSVLARMGRGIEPIVKPLGWDWRIGCAVIASFPAREVVVATLGVIYGLGDEQDEKSVPLRQRLQSATWDATDRPVFNVPVALSIMVFFALCAQCAATLAVIRRETNSWRWPLFTFAYMTGLAYIGAYVTYQVGMWVAS